MTALFVTGAFAQSNVTLSGQVDIGVVNPIGPDKTRIDQSGNGANQIVFSGSEDLGGGLRATFRLAQRFSPESGLNDGTFGNRPLFQGESTVGLAGPFGTVRIGRALTALRGPVDATDPWGTFQQASVAVVATGYASAPDNIAVRPLATAGATPVYGVTGSGAGRVDGLHYVSPSYNGFSAALTYGPKGSQITGVTTEGEKHFVSGWVQYAAGPFSVGLGGEENRAGDRLRAIQGTYKLGEVKLGATYGRVEPAGSALERRSYNVGLVAPVGPVVLKAGYGRSKEEGAEASIRKVGVGVDYSLSKRTLVYTSYGRDNGVGTNGVTLNRPKSGFDLGVRHTF